jgi:hypothetical protein
MRGEGIMNKKGPGREQWPASAMLLVGRPEFCGPTFSSGDKYIYRVSHGEENHGSPETWIRAGINHHMTVVSRHYRDISATRAVKKSELLNDAGVRNSRVNSVKLLF